MGTLIDPTATLVSLSEVKDYLNIPDTDSTQDAKLNRWIRSARTTIESVAGPVLLQQFEEIHDGGQYFIMVNRRPSTTYGTTPILTVQACSEYNGPIEWPLSEVASPDMGQLYSVEPDVPVGRIVRRTAGGGVQAFPNMPQSVHIWYTAGQSSVPDNIVDGTLELIRIRFSHTQQRRPAGSVSDEGQPDHDSVGFLVPYSVRELIAPNRRFPSLA